MQSLRKKKSKTRISGHGNRPAYAEREKAPSTGSRARNHARAGKVFSDLVALQERLLAPNGCPWDREQTHESLRTYLIEEAYEVLDALESGDADKFAEELGDLLLQIIFHSALASQAGRFDVSDVIERVHTKMVRRHPHVFGNRKAGTAAQVLKNWEQLKAEERRAARANNGKSTKDGDKAAPSSLLDGIPHTLPAVLEAYQVARRAARVGFDWPDISGVLDKLREESSELERALAARNADEIESEAGDLLFAAVNVARFLKLDPEIVLKKSNRKFIERFQQMEIQAAAEGRKLADMNAAELDVLWNNVKSKQRKSVEAKSAQLKSEQGMARAAR
ncbi:MAG TPA: nucleoside triphosphate pyrophosphohydrolase [Candidatus Acidoferrales bacterium]|nr:nucleoside triphosphate pyrophosphohydrolase [Candidatus Acidoferrales bacterium]